jgi:Ca2+-binding RTX toxin-like protein
MRKVLLAALCTAIAALLVPAFAGAAIQTTNVVQGNDPGVRGATVTYALPTDADEGALVGPTICLPAPGTPFLVGTTAVGCSSFVDGGEICVPLLGCIQLPDAPVGGLFNVTVNIVQCTLAGDGVANDLVGTAQRDWICGRGGADILRGNGGPDLLVGGAGADQILGGGGRDVVLGGGGNDTVKVRGGLRDRVNCGPGSNDLVIADSRDVVKANCERVRRG